MQVLILKKGTSGQNLVIWAKVYYCQLVLTIVNQELKQCSIDGAHKKMMKSTKL